MNIFLFFDYIYYRLASVYKVNFGAEDNLYALFILSIIQSVNFWTLQSLIIILRKESNEFYTFLMLLLSIVILMGYNAIRYNMLLTYQDLNIKWGEEKKEVRAKRLLIMVLYFIFSIIISAYIVNLSISVDSI